MDEYHPLNLGMLVLIPNQWTSPLSVDTKVHQGRRALALNSFRVGGAEM